MIGLGTLVVVADAFSVSISNAFANHEGANEKRGEVLAASKFQAIFFAAVREKKF